MTSTRSPPEEIMDSKDKELLALKFQTNQLTEIDILSLLQSTFKDARDREIYQIKLKSGLISQDEFEKLLKLSSHSQPKKAKHPSPVALGVLLGLLLMTLSFIVKERPRPLETPSVDPIESINQP